MKCNCLVLGFSYKLKAKAPFVWRKAAASRAEESPADPSNPGRAKLSNLYITLQKTWRTVYMTRLSESPL